MSVGGAGRIERARNGERVRGFDRYNKSRTWMQSMQKTCEQASGRAHGWAACRLLRQMAQSRRFFSRNCASSELAIGGGFEIGKKKKKQTVSVCAATFFSGQIKEISLFSSLLIQV